jgi:diguanylate cyclase (GGDEF)-like protein/PAS domain S-box-containing protein
MELNTSDRFERLPSVLFRIAQTSTAVEGVGELYAALHTLIGELVYARNFYVALRDDAGQLTFPYFVDEMDPEPPAAPTGRTLTEYVMRTGHPLLATPEVFSRLQAEGEVDAVGAPSLDWMGVPLVRGGHTFGMLAMQSYTPGLRFSLADLELLNFVSQHFATAMDRQRAADALRESEDKFRTLADTAAVAIFIHDGSGFRYANDLMALTTGYHRDELLALTFEQLVHPDFRDLARERALPGAHGSGIPGRCELKLARKDGTERWIDLSAGLIEYGGRTAVLGTALDVTRRKGDEAEIRSLAYQDALTGLPNRQLFLDHLALAIAQAPRHRKSVAVLFVDVDRLKAINDSLGHLAGDHLLQQLGARLQDALRDGDTIARIEGDDFAVIAPGVVNVEAAAKVAQKLQEALHQPFVLEGTEVFASVSIGISLYPADGQQPELLLTNASTAMYRAKGGGRNGFQTYDDSQKARAVERLALENGLHRAIANGELLLHYQPIVELATGRVQGVEALLRWNHPTRGPVSPGVFIEIAEQSGLILSIGEWALRTACAQVHAQRAVSPDLRVAVNLSARQFQDRRLVDEVARALRESGLEPRALELEITETAAMHDAAGTATTLRQLKDLGVRISLDDFGTGHSSLAYLRRFPIDTLKIDQSFVRDMGTDSQATAIVATIISMARSLGLRVLAEGVETAVQRDFLRDFGCDEVQGYLLARPMPIADLAQRLQDETASAVP